MAVVQISRIQVRRGKANSGTGIPQLASGEIAWALDTQELYIGNGAVAEGAPAVGNTKIITELDLTVNGNILNILQYIYKVSDPGMQTGATANTPTTRSIQTRLDDSVFAADFGANGLGAATDDTEALQRAIDQLFLNTTRSKASANTPDGIGNRIILNLGAGVYNVSSTLYVPSYASLVGAGDDKTIINFTGTGSAIQFVNDNSVPGTPDVLSNTLYITQPRNILFKGITIQTNSNNQTALQLDAVRDSVFENITLTGAWGGVYNVNSIGIAMNVVSALITCERNILRDITISGFSYAAYSKQDILNNTFRDLVVSNCQRGIILGYQANTNVIGQQYGPRDTLITNCYFEDIKHHAVYIGVGTGNTVHTCKFINVGNNGAGNTQPAYPQIYFASVGNIVELNQSDRPDDLAGTSNSTVPYVPEVAGHAVYKSYGARQVTIGQLTGYAIAFRLPSPTDDQSSPAGDISYLIDYTYKSTANNYSRRGTLKIMLDVDASAAGNTPVVQLTDEYEFAGVSEANALSLDFRAKLLDYTGAYYTGAFGTAPYTLAIEYNNSLSGDSGVLTYSYSSTF